MRRVTVVYRDGSKVQWKAESSSWGQESRNLVLRKALLVTGAYPLTIDYVVIPLDGVLYVMEDEW